MAAALRAEVNGGFYQVVAQWLDSAERARLLGSLVVDPVSRHSALPQLTVSALMATVSRLKQHLALLACLVHTARIRARDEVVTMFCKRMAAIIKKGPRTRS